MNSPRNKLEQGLGRAAVLVLMVGCLIVMRPFVTTLLWAVVLCFSCWPIFRRLLRWVGNRQTLAALLMGLAMVLIILVPFVLIGTTLADNVSEFTTAAKHWIKEGPPAPPEWLARVPLVGQAATDRWLSMSQDTAKFWA